MEKPPKIEVDLTPELIKNGTLDYAEYMISANSLLPDSVPWIQINNKYQLIQQHPYSSIYVCPILPNKQPTLNEIWLINDYISFMNEIPSIPIPDTTSFKNLGYEYLYGRNRYSRKVVSSDLSTGEKRIGIIKPFRKYELENRTFLDTNVNILSEICDLKLGPFAGIQFYLSNHETSSINLNKEIEGVEKEVQFYAMALRQTDFYAELLFYYRIFESLNPRDHYGLLNQCIDDIGNWNFKPLYIWNTFEHYKVKPQNLYNLMIKRAIKRIDYLKNIVKIDNLGKYLYERERCEIAHGRTSARVSQLGKEYFSTYNNMLIIKLAAKIAIYKRISENCSRTTAST